MTELPQRTLAVLAFAIALFAGIAHVGAQELSEEEITRYQQLVAEGAKLYTDGQYADSIARLEQAKEIYDHPDLTYNIGRAQARMKRCDAARASFDAYLGRDGLSKQAIADANEQLSELEGCRAAGVVEFACNVAATVDVSGESASCPGSVELEEGEVVARATADGHEPSQKTVSVIAGQTTNVTFELAKTPPPEPPADTGGPNYAAYGAVGFGVALLGTGFAIDAGTGARRDKLRAAAGDPAEIESLRSAGRTARGATIVLYSLGVVGIGTGITWLLIDSGGDDVEQASIGISPTGLAGRW